MTNQIELFTPAIEHKERGLRCLQEYDLNGAKDALEVARDIDPHLADTRTYLEVVAYLLSHNVHASTGLIGLARVWQKLQEDASLSSTVRSLVENLLCQRIVDKAPPGFCELVSPEDSRLHIGACYLKLGRPQEAHRVLLEFLTRQPGEANPRLWGYFGDASCLLHSHEEANAAYVRALFGGPEDIDLENMKHLELRQLGRQLCRDHGRTTGLALWPIHAWLAKHLYIPRAAHWLTKLVNPDHVQEQAFLQAGAPAPERYRRFAALLLIDQAGITTPAGSEPRIRMQRLDNSLFRQYLKRLEASQ